MQSRRTILLKVNKEIKSVDLDNVLYIQSLGNYLKVFTTDGVLITMMTMSQMEDQLQGNDFIRVHRSYLANMLKITSVADLHVGMGTRIIPIGKTYKQYVQRLLKKP